MGWFTAPTRSAAPRCRLQGSVEGPPARCFRRRVLLHEARASSALSVIPTSARSTKSARSDGELYIVMELVEGKSLERADRRRGLPPSRSCATAAQIAGALARAHDRGIVHRDLKARTSSSPLKAWSKFWTSAWPRLINRVARRRRDALVCAAVQEGSRMSGTLPLHGAGNFARRAGRLSQRSLVARGRALRSAVGTLALPGTHRIRNQLGHSPRIAEAARPSGSAAVCGPSFNVVWPRNRTALSARQRSTGCSGGATVRRHGRTRAPSPM